MFFSITALLESSTASSPIVTFVIVSSEGTSYISSNIVCSIIALSPLAPILLSRARVAIFFRASGVNSSSTPSKSNNFLYCFTIAFLGSVNIFIRAASSKSCKVVMIGNLPTNSGIIPCFTRSSGKTLAKVSPTFSSTLLLISAPKPITFLFVLDFITFSSPSKAPPTINRILVVSISINSWFGCFLPP